MYNTLKEIQDALSYEDLCKYVDKTIGKTAEEIIKILKKDNIEISAEAAKECVEYLKGVDAILNKELENVTGGVLPSEIGEREKPRCKICRERKFLIEKYGVCLDCYRKFKERK